VSTVERTEVRQVGRSAPRRDAAEKLRGQAQFAGDIVLHRMLHG
jgi:CO/xanthine dehydrogenase Mo-binding subunit